MATPILSVGVADIYVHVLVKPVLHVHAFIGCTQMREYCFDWNVLSIPKQL